MIKKGGEVRVWEHTHTKRSKNEDAQRGGAHPSSTLMRERRECALLRAIFFFLYSFISRNMYAHIYLSSFFLIGLRQNGSDFLDDPQCGRLIDWLSDCMYFFYTHTQFFLLPSTLLAWVLWCVMRAQFLHTTTQLLLLYKYYYWGLSLETRTLSYVTHVKRGLNTQLFVFTHTFCIIIWIYYTHWVGWKNSRVHTIFTRKLRICYTHTSLFIISHIKAILPI